MNRVELLNAAMSAATGRDDQERIPMENSFADIAKIWSVIFGVKVEPYQVTLAMAGLKIVRANTEPTHDDNWTDMAGYAACGTECVDAYISGSTPDKPDLVIEEGKFYVTADYCVVGPMHWDGELWAANGEHWRPDGSKRFNPKRDIVAEHKPSNKNHKPTDEADRKVMPAAWDNFDSDDREPQP